MDLLGLDKPPADCRVVVAMSGGVDSSVTAALLAEAGYDVIGVTLQLYDHGAAVGRKGACCAGQDIHDARNVADRIGIPHYVLDFESRFRESVIDDFAESYVRGETPVPCVRCNQTVKFRDLLGTAKDLEAVALATGHYARREAGAAGPELHRARDLGRDQSYFLFATTTAQLDYLRFPLGGMTKDETRDLAERFDLPVAAKPDSQDICFVPEGSYARVIEKLRPEAVEPGEIVDLAGAVLGRHDGIVNFTVGQRRGIDIGGRTPDSEPLYVVRLEPEARRVVVGPKVALAVHRIALGEVNWLGAPLGEEPLGDGALGNGALGDGALGEDGIELSVKIRSTTEPVPATVRINGEVGDGRAPGAEVTFAAPEFGVSPGQACVLYAGERVMGGGWILRKAG